MFPVDTGPRTWPAPPLLAAAQDVATHAASQGPRFATLCEPALVNGVAGAISRSAAGVVAVVGSPCGMSGFARSTSSWTS
jgi:RNA polymerase sigma-70 factor (ECF subfamily)